MIIFLFQYIQKKAKEWNADITFIAELKFDLKKTMKVHKRDSVDIEVDLIRLSHKKDTTEK